MKLILKTLLLALVPVAAVCYLIGAFIAASFNIADWTFFGRYMITVVYLAMCGVIVVLAV